MSNMIQECVDIIKDLVGHDYLYFDSAIEVKTSPHTHPFMAWGVCVSPRNEIYIMDSDQEWHKVEPEIGNASLVIGSLYQRLQLMRRKYAKAS